MNSFLSEIPDYFRILNKVFFYSKKYIIIHRQEFDSNSTYLQNYNSYANLQTTKTVIQRNEFDNVCDKNNIDIKIELNSLHSQANLKTLLLFKND